MLMDLSVRVALVALSLFSGVASAASASRSRLWADSRLLRDPPYTDLRFAQDGHAFLVSKWGRIWALDPPRGSVAGSTKGDELDFEDLKYLEWSPPLMVLDLSGKTYSEGRGFGMLAFAIHPLFPQVPFGFIIATLADSTEGADFDGAKGICVDLTLSRVRFQFDEDGTTVVGGLVDPTPLLSAPSSSTAFGSSGAGLSFDARGNLYVSLGASAREAEASVEQDPCYDLQAGGMQGPFRALREDFWNGKLIRLPAGYLVQEALTPQAAAVGEWKPEILLKGLHQPIALHVDETSGDLYVSDRVQLEMSSRISVYRLPSLAGASPPASFDLCPSAAWPCAASKTLAEHRFCAKKNNSQLLNAYVDYGEGGPLPDDDRCPSFVKGLGLVSDISTTADGMLVLADSELGCVYSLDSSLHWDVLVFGLKGLRSVKHYPGTSGAILALLEGGHSRLSFLRSGETQTVSDEQGASVDFSSPNSPFYGKGASPVVSTFNSCADPFNYPELLLAPETGYGEWGQLVVDHRVLVGRLSYGPVMVQVRRAEESNNEIDGSVTTRGYNGLFPGPLLRLHPCQRYRIELSNDAWSDQGEEIVTNIYTGGLHVSGAGFTEVERVYSSSNSLGVKSGDTQPFFWDIPCDHVGGTHMFHPFFHGSSALQTAAGSLGVIVVEDSPFYEKSSIPAEYTDMREGVLVFTLLDLPRIRALASSEGDSFFSAHLKSSRPDTLVLVNGCADLELPVETGQWIRLRMLFSGLEAPHFLDLQVADDEAGEPSCEMRLIAKDGVYLWDVPRKLPSPRLYFAPGSRVDVVLRCTTEGEVHSFRLSSTESTGVSEETVRIIPTPSDKDMSANLPQWSPTRPAYLEASSPEIALEKTRSLEVTGSSINGLSWIRDEFTQFRSSSFSLQSNVKVDWIVSSTLTAPLRFQTHSFQLMDVDTGGWDVPEGWYTLGDWHDTLSLGVGMKFRLRSTISHFGGPFLVHSSPTLADQGSMATAHVHGGYLPLENVYRRGYPVPAHAAQLLPLSMTSTRVSSPFRGRGRPLPIPGLIEAEWFNVGAETYFSDTTPWNEGGKFRLNEGVDVVEDALDPGNYHVASMESGEYIRYTIEVAKDTSLSTLEVNMSLDSELDLTSSEILWYVITGPIGLSCDSTANKVHLATIDKELLLRRGKRTEKGDLEQIQTLEFHGLELNAGIQDLVICVAHGDESLKLDFLVIKSGSDKGSSLEAKFENTLARTWNGMPFSVSYHPTIGDDLKLEVHTQGRKLVEAEISAAGLLSPDQFKGAKKEVQSDLASLSAMGFRAVRFRVGGDPHSMPTHLSAMLDICEKESLSAVVDLNPSADDDLLTFFERIEALKGPLLDNGSALQLLVLSSNMTMETDIPRLMKFADHLKERLNSWGVRLPVAIDKLNDFYYGYPLADHTDVVLSHFNPMFMTNMSDEGTLQWLVHHILGQQVSLSEKLGKKVYLTGIGWSTDDPPNHLSGGTSEERQAFFLETFEHAVQTHAYESRQVVHWELREARDWANSSYGLLDELGTAKKLAVAALQPTYLGTANAIYIGTGVILVWCLLLIFFGLWSRYRIEFDHQDDEDSDKVVAEIPLGSFIDQDKKFLLRKTRSICNMPLRRGRGFFIFFTCSLSICLLTFHAMYTMWIAIRGSESIGIIVGAFLVEIFIAIPFLLFPVLNLTQSGLYLLSRVSNNVFENSEFFSSREEPRSDDPDDLLSVTVVVAVYKEGLDSIIKPSVMSIVEAMKNFQANGGEVNLLIADDGLQILSGGLRSAREKFYSSLNSQLGIRVGYTARPPHSVRERRGCFKKASNLNYMHSAIEAAEHFRQCNPQASVDEVTRAVCDAQDHLCIAGGELKLGDLVLLLDSDSRIPIDCMLRVQGEFQNHPNLGFTQCRSQPLLISEATNWVLKSIAFETAHLWDRVMLFSSANGTASPLVGHNAFLRTQALREAKELSGMFWSEDHVSEDFELMLRLQTRGYIGRYITYTGDGFFEGISLSADEDVSRQARFAYGAAEVIFNRPQHWPTRGPFATLYKDFLRSEVTWTSKFALSAYLFNFFAKAWAVPSMVWVLVMILFPYIDAPLGILADPLKILIGVTISFNSLSLLATIKYMWQYSSRQESWFQRVWHRTKQAYTCIVTGIVFSTLYHGPTLMEATDMIWQFVTKDSESVTFPATRKGSVLNRSTLVHMKDYFGPKAWTITRLATITAVSGVGVVINDQLYAELTGRVPVVVSRFHPLFWFVPWWVIVLSHTLYPLILILLEHGTTRVLDPGDLDDIYRNYFSHTPGVTSAESEVDSSEIPNITPSCSPTQSPKTQ